MQGMLCRYDVHTGEPSVCIIVDRRCQKDANRHRWYVKMKRSGALHYSDAIMGTMTSQITGVSIICPTVCSTAGQIKHQSSASLASVRGIHRWPVDSPHKGSVTRKMFPFDDVIMECDCVRRVWCFSSSAQLIVWFGRESDLGKQVGPSYFINKNFQRIYDKINHANLYSNVCL